MYDILHVPKTGSWARKAMAFLEFDKTIQISDSIKELAKTEMLIPSVEGINANVLTYVSDWNGRCVLVDRDSTQMSKIALDYSRQTNKNKILIVTEYSRMKQWYDLVKNFFPDKTISVFGKDKYIMRINFSQDSTNEVSSIPNIDAEIFITSGEYILNTNVLGQKIDQIIVDYCSNIEKMGHHKQESIRIITRTAFSVIMMVNLNDFISEKTINIEQSLNNYFNMSINEQWHLKILYPNLKGLMTKRSAYGLDDGEKYYGNAFRDNRDKYKAFGMNHELLNVSLKSHVHVHYIAEKETHYIKEDNDTILNNVRESLKTTKMTDHELHSHKAHSIGVGSYFFTSNGIGNARTIFVVNHKSMIRHLLEQDKQMIHIETSKNPGQDIANYLHPNMLSLNYGTPNNKKVKRIILSSDMLHGDLLTMTSNIILMDLPNSKEEYLNILEKAEKYRCTVYVPIVQNSSDVEAFQKLS